MSEIRHIIGVDVSTQTISAMLIVVMESDAMPSELVISSAWTASRPCRDEIGRKTPCAWIRLVRECIDDLKKAAREAELAESVGVCTTFPGIFPILTDGAIDPALVSLYDNTDDAGVFSGGFEEMLGRAESDTLNRMWPGNMAIGLAHLIKSEGLKLTDTAALVPPNTAFAFGLLHAVGREVDPRELVSDFTETAISGLYDARSGWPVPPGVADLLRSIVPEISYPQIKSLLPPAVPSWRNIVPDSALPSVRSLLGLPRLKSVSIGGGDSPIGVLALMVGPDTVVNVRGSSDTPIILVDSPRERAASRETVIHYPLSTATSASDSPWCVAAPMLRSGKVWDWVRGLCFRADDPNADSELELLAKAALKRRLKAPPDSPLRKPLRFDTALGGERAPSWDPYATGVIAGLVESHSIGDIALAALEGMSAALKGCMTMVEERYEVRPTKLLLAGGPAKNALWNWVTEVFTGKKTSATTFSDASLLGAAIMGYAAAFDGEEHDASIVRRLLALSKIASAHPLVSPTPVAPPDEELAEIENEYIDQARSAAT